MIDKLKSRKLLIVSILFVVATVFLATSFLTGAQWIDFIKWLFGLYVAGNVGEHYSKKGTP